MWDTRAGQGILLALDRDDLTWADDSRQPTAEHRPELDALRLRLRPRL